MMHPICVHCGSPECTCLDTDADYEQAIDEALCLKCGGKGLVWVHLNALGISDAAIRILRAGAREDRRDDGTVWTELVCPWCDGKGLITAR